MFTSKKTEPDSLINIYERYNKATSSLKSIEDSESNEIAKIKKKHWEKKNLLETQKNEELIKLYDWATANRKEFGEKQSMEVLNGSIGFRKGKIKFKPMTKEFEETVIAALKKGKLKKYLAEKVSIAKTALLKDREDPKTKALMDELGIETHQEETFFVKLN